MLAGLPTGVAVAAKYSAVFLLPVIAVSHLSRLDGRRGKKVWLYAGILLGFLLGEPYALVHRGQFWTSVKPYLQFGGLPEGAVPGIFALLGMQLKNLAIFGFGMPLTLILLAAAYRFLQRSKNVVSRQAPKFSESEICQSEGAGDERQAEAPITKETKAAGLGGCPGQSTEPRPDNPLAVSSTPLSPFVKRELSPQSILLLAILSFVLSILILRQPMLRYTLPVAALLVFAAAH